MTYEMKLELRIVMFFVIAGLVLGCGRQGEYEVISGEAQGTTFSIKFKNKAELDLEEDIDSILVSMDMLFSTYVDKSMISEFNRSTIGIEVNDEFIDLWEKCWELNIESDGYFDPTLSPVFDVYTKMKETGLDSSLIEEALSHTGMHLVSLQDKNLIKKDRNLRLNLNAVAQGYSVDIISEFLDNKGIKNYMVEIGGELYARGKNDKGKVWTIGVDKPKDGPRELIGSIELDGLSMATSGNYRKFVEVDGKRMGHIINPRTGFPGYSNILSISVLAENCYRADALATALMTRSSEEIKEFDDSTDDIQIILIELIEKDTSIYISKGLKGYKDF